ncbi:MULTISPECIES: CoA ester lyase [unclassified Achromobacter]|uniref:HpcH/HpaI aldolase/citrate lyase family protein n=1 Tax=unclassified Achromobacter TaxID=2626865 RepID=UPI000B519F09|nr:MULTISPECIES: CoA ester lyase [unclassified Achromobacter]OWT68264.1 CoA ester lyase [Achromobacter sp. HZ34]OWT70101.1 CoA ester lyase [Achromobacter sp. HZ28]
MRSKLFVPGSRPELFPKALASEADGLSFDLEDSVSESRKGEARQELGRLFASDAAVASGKVLIVRVNAQDTPHFHADVQAVVRPGLQLVNVPKVDSVEQVVAAAAAVIKAERENGFENGTTEPVRLLLNIESPRALRLAADLAGAHERVAGLQLGLGDLFEPLNIVRRDAEAVRLAMFQLRVAAGEAGVFAYDTAFADIKDQEGYLAEAAMARRLGFLGKSCIHPSQVALANQAFRPSDEEIAHAQRVVEAAADAQARGVGAYVVDGKMIDGPFVRRAQAVVELARRLGLLAA